MDDTYYMASTTMHMSAGLPIMKCEDLVNWEMVSYAYDTLGDTDAMAMRNRKNCYSRGWWARIVGRTPFLVPVERTDGWPLMGIDGTVPMTLEIPAGRSGMSNIVASDEFDREVPVSFRSPWHGSGTTIPTTGSGPSPSVPGGCDCRTVG